MMKLSKREKILLLILSNLLIITGFYYYLFVPKMNKIKKLNSEVEIYRQKISEVKEKKSSDKRLNNDLKNIDNSISNMTKNLLPSMKQEKIIIVLNEMLTRSNLEGQNIGFSDIKVGSVDNIEKVEEDKENKEQNVNKSEYILKQLVDQYKKIMKIPVQSEANKPKSKNKNNINVENMSVTISFKGSYADLMSFIKEIEAYEKKILIKSINISEEEKYSLKGNIVLEFYSIPKFHEQDEEYLKWDYNKGKYGKYDPFIE